MLDATYSVNLPSAVTVAGVLNGSQITGQTILYNQAGIALDSNNILYVGDNGNRTVAFAPNNLTGQVLHSYPQWVTLLDVENSTSYLYLTVLLAHLAYIYPTNKTIPPNGIPGTTCNTESLYFPSGIVVDSYGNVYIASMSCNWVTKWKPNATNSTIIAGLNSSELYAPFGMALDESNGYLYIADRYNNRIQRYSLNGTGVAVTVAGGNGVGSNPNQLNNPTDVYFSKKNGSLYVADRSNNRIQKWTKNATYGITVLGSPNGTSGSTSFLLNRPYSITFDGEEKYMYVSDSLNNRVQQIQLF